MLQDYGIIVDLLPHGGWHYFQPFDGDEQRIPPEGNCESGDELVAQVQDFRAVNHLPLGNAEFDIRQQIVARSPQNDRWKGVIPPGVELRGATEREDMPLAQRALEWLLDTAKKRPKLVSQFDARQRSAICEDCPRNVAWRTGYAAVDEQTEQRAKDLRQRPIFDQDFALQFCVAHGILLPAGVFLDQDFLPERDELAPLECWIPLRNFEEAKT